MNSKHKPIKRLLLDFYPSEVALVEQVAKQPRQQTYIKDLIRKDLTVRGGDPFVEAIVALRALGADSTNISLHQVFGDRVAIAVDGEYFGLWDTGRKTFVD